MTATPDKRDDNIEGRNVYEIFNHQIAYEIRLQQAMEEDLLCPFHYFGINDAFEDSLFFRWDSQIGRGINSSYAIDVLSAPRKHLMVKKNDNESNFYYMGEFDVVDAQAAKKEDNNGKERDITKFLFRMKRPVREDLLKYLQSNLIDENKKLG